MRRLSPRSTCERLTESFRLPAQPLYQDSRPVDKVKQTTSSRRTIRLADGMVESVERLSPEDQPGQHEKQGRVGQGVERGQATDPPGDHAPVVNDQVPDVVELQMRNDEITDGQQRLQRFGHL